MREFMINLVKLLVSIYDAILQVLISPVVSKLWLVVHAL
jgi:hypothetical protein